MDKELFKEAARLYQRVYSDMRARTSMETFGYTQMIQFIELPSFGNPKCIDICQADKGGNNRAVRVRWRRDLDATAFSSPAERTKHPHPFVPTVETAEYAGNQDRIVRLTDRLFGLAIPVYAPDCARGLDGTTYELAVGPLQTECRLNWWCEIPGTWESITPLVNDLSELMKSDEWENAG